MTVRKVVEVSLPDDVDLTSEDLELSGAVMRAVLSLGHEEHQRLEQALLQLQSEGWEVMCRLGWIAEAKRGREFEQAFGATRQEALMELHTLTAMDEREGCST